SSLRQRRLHPRLRRVSRAEPHVTSTRMRLVKLAIFVAFVVATVARGAGPFKWDAAHYWSATQAMLGLVPSVPDGYWELRGVFTPLVFAPAAARSGLVDHPYADHAAVLLQNSLVFAAAAVF